MTHHETESSFFKLIENRRSIRQFKTKSVDDNMLAEVLRAANLAPSAGNLQAYEIYVVTNQKQRQALSKAAFGQECLTTAPVTLVFCANTVRSGTKYSKRGETLYCIQDATIAATYAQLACTATGLASVWVGAFDHELVSEALTLPKAFRPVAMLPVGFPDEKPEAAERRTLDDLVHYV